MDHDDVLLLAKAWAWFAGLALAGAGLRKWGRAGFRFLMSLFGLLGRLRTPRREDDRDRRIREIKAEYERAVDLIESAGLDDLERESGLRKARQTHLKKIDEVIR
jgi:hypothetical protein